MSVEAGKLGPMRAAALAAAALLACPTASFAWSAHSHEAIALMALDILRNQSQSGDQAATDTLSQITSILGGNATLDQVAPCPDEIRTPAGSTCNGVFNSPISMPQSEQWHFINIPISDSNPSTDQYCSGDNCVVNQIKNDVAELQSPQGRFNGDPGIDRALALIFLTHFVGDESQPLHCSDEIVDGKSDLGGNTKKAHWSSKEGKEVAGDPGGDYPEVTAQSGLNFHALWDHVIGPTDSIDPATIESDAQNAVGDASQLTSGDFVTQAALESFQIARQTVYPSYYSNNGSFGPAYQSQMQPIAFSQIGKAGVRLAALLKTALSGQSNDSVAQQSRDHRRRKTIDGAGVITAAAADAQVLAQ